MGTLFYELHDLYQAAREDFDSDSMPESIMQKCKRAAEVQQTFLGQINRSLGFDKPIGCVQKLMGILETDCIPVPCLVRLPCMIRYAVSNRDVMPALHVCSCYPLLLP